MGIMIGGNVSGLGQVSFRAAGETKPGTYSSVRRSTSGNGVKKPKRLQYNFKEISSLIMRAKTSVSAGRAITLARGKVAQLERKRRSGEYDESELEHAILHAMKMERIARKRLKHLKMEEAAKNNGAASDMPQEEDFKELDLMDAMREEPAEAGMDTAQMSQEELQEMAEEMQEMTEELQRCMEEDMSELMQELEETEREMSCGDLAEEMGMTVSGEMEPEDLERLKKKHRAAEQREITEADMKYLRFLFEKYAREKASQAGAPGSAQNGIALELAGTEIPVEAVQAPVPPEGGSVDLAL